MIKNIFILILLFIISSPAIAGGNKVDNAEELRFLDQTEAKLDKCADTYERNMPFKSENFPSAWAFSNKRVAASHKYKECTHYVYNSLIKRYYTKDSKAWKRISEKYNKGLEGVEDIADEIYFSADYCTPTCGLMWEHDVYLNAAGYNQTMARNIIDYHRWLFK